MDVDWFTVSVALFELLLPAALLAPQECDPAELVLQQHWWLPPVVPVTCPPASPCIYGAPPFPYTPVPSPPLVVAQNCWLLPEQIVALLGLVCDCQDGALG